MARSKEKRINTYFGRTVEENELWEYLLINHPDDMASYLKYYARLGMMQVIGVKEQELINTPTNSKPLKKRTQRKTQQSIQSVPIIPEKERNLSIPSEDATPSTDDVDPLEGLELNILEVDSTQKLEQVFNRFIPEEDDEEILELLKSQITPNSQEKKTG